MTAGATVLGGTSGLGKQLVRSLPYQLSPVGQKIIRVGRRTERNPDPLIVDVVADLSKGTAKDLLVQAHEEAQVFPLLMFHCMGANLITDTQGLTMSSFDALMRINVWSAVAAAQALLELRGKHLRNLDAPITPETRPTLVLIGSSASDGAGARSLAYVASKHALTGVTRSLARDFQGGLNVIQVNLPKLADTEMSEYIDREQAAFRGTSVAQERERQEHASPAGRLMPSWAAAQYLLGLVGTEEQRAYLHGSIIKLGYSS